MLLLLPAASHAQWQEVKRQMAVADMGKGNVDSLREATYLFAKASLAKNPNSADEHWWFANAAGRYAQASPSRRKIELSKVVKYHAEEAIRLNPTHAGAHLTLGGWHFYVADLSWVEKNISKVLFGKLPDASYEKAVYHLTFAINNNVEEILEAYYIRALAYDALDEEAKARADFKAVLTHKARTNQERRKQQEARDWLD